MENTNLSTQESLNIINQMIQAARHKYERGAGRLFLLWGYVTVIVTLAVFFERKFSLLALNNSVYYIFFAIPIIGYPLMLLLFRRKPKSANTYIDKVINYVWLTISIMAVIPTVIIAFNHSINIMFIMGLIMPIGVMITALVLKYRFMFLMGLTAAVLNYFMLLSDSIDVKLLLFASIFFVSMVITGHSLNFKGSKADGQ